ncbi:MAG TPA: hypothetical protein VNK24_09280 [Elusimicrobiota bacterium]|nr:hypothetical protein [Elusimicrobiota bacterium]
MKTTRRTALTISALLAAALSPARARALSHGPAFGLATPTLGEGSWVDDAAAMTITDSQGSSAMFRDMIGYGVTQDLQANISVPLSPALDRLAAPPRTRGSAMMGSFGDIEPSLMWRFQRRAPAVGERYESTAFLSGSIPTEEAREGVRVGPGMNAALVTGYASRTIYWWLGGGYQRYFSSGGDRLGDLPYISAVFGWRPPMFRGDYPKPDWRLFVESLGEFPGKDRIGGVLNPDSGGTKFLLGPSALGLYGGWGVEAGVLFPVYQELDGRQSRELYRTVFDFTYWFN